MIQSKHNIYFAAANIRGLIDNWHPFTDLSKRTEILATLYHLPYKTPHGDPKANERGAQISTEFYKLAQKWLPQ